MPGNEAALGEETVDDLRGSVASIKARCEERIAEAIAAERERIIGRLADRWPGTSRDAIAALIGLADYST